MQFEKSKNEELFCGNCLEGKPVFIIRNDYSRRIVAYLCEDCLNELCDDWQNRNK